MQKSSLPIGESIRMGWNTMKQRIGFFILMLVVYYAVYFGLAFIVELVDNSLLYFILNIALYVVNILLSLGLVAITLSILDKKEPSVGDLFTQTDILPKGILLYILYSLIVLGGFILLIVPGIIWAIKYSMSFYLLVDKKLSATEALKQSAELTKGVKWELFLFGIVTALINIAGMLLLIVGLFATLPTTMMAYSYVYRKLLANKEMPVVELAKTPTAV